MQPVIIHLIGSPGVGKYTIARELVQRIDARLVDNHSIANAIFNAYGSDGVTPLPSEIWPRVMAVRNAVLDTILNLASPELSYVFTNYLHGGSAGDRAIFAEMVEVAEKRQSLFVPVVLTCETPALQLRISNEDRQERMKLIDPELGGRFNDEFPVFVSGHPHELRLDTTSTPPELNAERILEWMGALRS